MERLPKVVARRRRTYAHAKGKMPERGLDVRRLRHILDIPMDIFFEVGIVFRVVSLVLLNSLDIVNRLHRT